MAKINVINNATQDLTIDPGAAGDSFVQHDINTVGKFRIGVDDDAGDSFKISQGGALGANDTFVMTAAGERTMPLQCAFLAYLSITDANQTGTDVAQVDCDTEVFDQNNDYDTGTFTFTAPTTGIYRLIGSLTISDITNASLGYLRFITSNRIYAFDSRSPKDVKSASGTVGYNGASHVDMDAADTAFLQVVCTGEAGNPVDLVGSGSPYVTFFAGYLTC